MVNYYFFIRTYLAHKPIYLSNICLDGEEAEVIEVNEKEEENGKEPEEEEDEGEESDILSDDEYGVDMSQADYEDFYPPGYDKNGDFGTEDDGMDQLMAGIDESTIIIPPNLDDSANGSSPNEKWIDDMAKQLQNTVIIFFKFNLIHC